MENMIRALLQALALPEYGLWTAFLVSLLSATLLPLGSEPAVFGLVRINPQLFWPTMAVATAGNTLGGAVSWGMGRGMQALLQRGREAGVRLRALAWLQRMGPRACFFSFLPLVGDALCLVAGWMRLPLLPCMAWMAAGKFLRYLVLTSALLMLWPGTPAHAGHAGVAVSSPGTGMAQTLNRNSITSPSCTT